MDPSSTEVERACEKNVIRVEKITVSDFILTVVINGGSGCCYQRRKVSIRPIRNTLTVGVVVIIKGGRYQ